LTPAHGGRLVRLLVDRDRAAELSDQSRSFPSWDLTAAQTSDIEHLLTGAYSPLTGYLRRQDYEAVCANSRLTSGVFWPLPIVLDVPESTASSLEVGSSLALRDAEGVMVAVLTISEKWKPDLQAEAQAVFGTTSRDHPGVDRLLSTTNEWYLAGDLAGTTLPMHPDFPSLRLSPAEIRTEFSRLGWRRVIAFETNRPIHRADQVYMLREAMSDGAKLLLHAVVSAAQDEDKDYFARVRCYQAALPYYPHLSVKLMLSTVGLRLAGPRESLLRAIVNQNCGCSHFIASTDLVTASGEGNSADALVAYHSEFAGGLAISVKPASRLLYVPDLDDYVERANVPDGARVLTMSDKEVGERLDTGRDLPSWYTFREVKRELRRAHPPRHKQGFTVFFTGLSGAGKSTVAKVLQVKLLQMGDRPVTLLDGDIVRRNLSSELTFSKDHRDLNIRRIGFVASEITKNGGIAICAPIAPYNAVRKEVRQRIDPLGGFVLVHVSTPLETCEARDRKGLYAKARQGMIKEFTGISDPYEAPDDADVVIDTTGIAAEEAVWEVISHLERQGYLGSGIKEEDNL